MRNSGFFFSLWYMMMATTAVRFKYYFAWLLADAICNNSGLGFNGYDERDGVTPRWDMLSNIQVLEFEFGTNFRNCINAWNAGTNRWLRMVVFERVPKRYGTFLTFSLSALWHGFYPGYYMTFATGALIVVAARTARKLFREPFQRTPATRTLYDVLTCLVTRVFMGYATFPFVLLEFRASLDMYLNVFMCLHLVALITVFVLSKFVPRGKGRETSAERSRSKVKLVAEDNQSSSHLRETTEAAEKLLQSPTPITVESEAILTNGDLGTSGGSNTGPGSSQIRYRGVENGRRQERPLLSVTTEQPISASSNNHKKTDEQLSTEDNNNSATSNSSNTLITAPTNVGNGKSPKPTRERIKEKLEQETRNFEEFIDKTVTGFVELKDDLMRMNDSNMGGLYIPRKVNGSAVNGGHGTSNGETGDILNGSGNGITGIATTTTSGAFLKKEIDALNAAVQQANVLPAVLSNGHAK